MKRFHFNGISTPWLSAVPNEKELKRLTIPQLLVIVNKKKGIKQVLIDFILKTGKY